jgi:hypothetical protein
MEQEGIYSDPLERPVIDTLGKITAASTRMEVVHRCRSKLKSLEKVAGRALWNDIGVRDRVTKCIKDTDGTLSARTKEGGQPQHRTK